MWNRALGDGRADGCQHGRIGECHGRTNGPGLQARANPSVLTINGGSSSIRFAVYEAGATLRRQLAGKIDVAAEGYRQAVDRLLDRLEAQPVFTSIAAVGHRVVHGMTHSAPEPITS